MQDVPYEALRKAYLLSQLTEQQLDRVHRKARLVKLDAGQHLFSQGDEARCFYLVVKGCVKLFRLSPDGNEVVIEIADTSHDTFAEALMFVEHAHYPVSASALVASELICIDAHDYAEILRSSVDTCFIVMRSLTQRLHALIHEIYSINITSGTCRVATYLLENMPESENVVNLKVAKSVIAARLSITPESFSRILRNLSNREVISVKGSKITVLSRDTLKELSCQTPLPF